MAPGEAELRALFRQLHPKLCRFLQGLVGDRGLAQDLAQESFLRLHRSGAARLPPEMARFWLFRVARNLALNELGRRRTRARWREALRGWLRARRPEPSAEATLVSAATAGEVQALLRELPEPQRAALLLREQEEMSYVQIARVLGVSEAKVRVDLHRARVAMRARWRAHEAGAPRIARGRS